MGRSLHVVAGVLADGEGRVLIAQRPAGRHLAGGWEFPGGKVQAGESRETALRRELREEIGVEVQRCHPLIRLRHRYPEREVLLDVWRIDAFGGEPQSLDQQALRWCRIAELPQAQLLPADVPVITALRLPPCIGALRGAEYRLLPVAALASHRRTDQRLLGALCQSLEQAHAARAAGADFIVFVQALAQPLLAAACEQLNLPVFAAGVQPPQAWAAGAVGTARLPLAESAQRELR